MTFHGKNPRLLFDGYVSRFSKIVDATIIDRTDLFLEEKVNCLEALQEILLLHLENSEDVVDYELIENILTEKIIKPLRDKATPIYNAKVWQYFEPGSMQYLEYISSETGRTSFTDADNLTPEQHRNFLDRAHNILSVAQTMLYLKSPRSEAAEGLGDADKSMSKEFTLRRQVLVMYYLDKAHNISAGCDRTHFARLIELLTGKNFKNIYDYVCTPLPDKTSSRLVEDLKYIRAYFVKLGHDQIITLIDKDIQLHK